MVDLHTLWRPHTRIGLDTSLFIYHIEAVEPFAVAAEAVLRSFSQRLAIGITSVLTLTELLVKPLAAGRPGLAARYEELVREMPNMAVVDIDARIARRAAELRAAYRLQTADAIQIAAALEHGATAFITNDRALRRVSDLAVILLSDLAD